MPLPRSHVQTNIDYEDGRTALGLVSLYEEIDTAKSYGFTWREWRDLDPGEWPIFIAHQRVSSLIGLHARDAAEKAEKARQTRERARGKR